MRRVLWVGAAAALAVAVGGCRIGEGTGSVKGELHIKACLGTGTDRQDLDLPPPGADGGPFFDLDPTYFAAEPIDDPVRNAPLDQLRIRIQHNGAVVELVDSLIIDIVNLEQAAAMLGQEIPVVAGGAVHPPAAYDGDGGTAQSSGQEPVSPVRVTLSMLRTCQGSQSDRIAVGVLYADTNPSPVNQPPYRSWIRFTQLGSRGCPAGGDGGCDSTDGGAYSIDFGERITAEFDVALVDLRPEYLSSTFGPVARGHLTGKFNFIMRRGRVAQVFP
jgi:hypothetical protein